MFLCKSEAPAASRKATSPNKRSDSGRRVHFNSAPCRNTRQGLNFTTQGSPGSTAGAARPPYDGRVHEYGSSGKISDDDVDFILAELSKNTWRECIDDYKNDPTVTKILSNWKEFLELFLENCNFTSYGAAQSHTYHRPGTNDAAESHEPRDSKRTPIMHRMYKDSPGKRGRRKYEANEEIKRYLRHLAVVLKLSYEVDSEIQCYYHDEGNVVYIAANDPKDGNKLSEIEGRKISEYSAILQHSFSEINEPIADDDSSSIRSGSKDEPPFSRLGHPLGFPDALSGAKIHVIESREVLHAERKILNYLREHNSNDQFLDPLRLGGIRRPCFICSTLCLSDMSQVHSGPCWVSKAASTPKDIKEMFLILDAIQDSAKTTYITDHNGHLTTDYDTESSEGSECD